MPFLITGCYLAPIIQMRGIAKTTIATPACTQPQARKPVLKKQQQLCCKIGPSSVDQPYPFAKAPIVELCLKRLLAGMSICNRIDSFFSHAKDFESAQYAQALLKATLAQPEDKKREPEHALRAVRVPLNGLWTRFPGTRNTMQRARKSAVIGLGAIPALLSVRYACFRVPSCFS